MSNNVVHDYELDIDVVCFVETYRCAYCNCIIDTDKHNYVYCSTKCKVEHELSEIGWCG
jgi:hypothetical protein